MKKIFIPFAILFATMTFAQTQIESTTTNVEQTTAKKIILPEGTLVKASLKNEIRGGKMQVGNQIEFTLNQPLVIADQVVVPQGAKILGSVTEARSSGVLGRKGKLAFDIEYLYLDNGQVVKLTGQSAKNLKGSGVIVGVAAAINPLGLLIPGKGAKFEAGTVFDAYVAKDTELR
ncbi:hypothetical protein [Chryseobacterium taklimakanense]|uniref:DUF5666 domain-containing protein n=1 Tax=Chryseobacterium taklimakanense TaxID=536441 RepID=A0A3G8WI39_9FLAO|nr:hypothetical protein [Chryseobacterium taklimakanense]AZI20835.1 hypothetical protein EIH08_09095 [Chryseobacterium taklimakanense]